MKASDVVDVLNKKFGKSSVVKLSDKSQYLYGENVIPTGSLNLDLALGIGGYPRGRIIEIQGNAQGGKTTCALHAVAEAQKMGLEVLYIDAEHSLDVFYAKAIGVDVDKMFINQPEFGEQALNIIDMAIRSAAFGLVIVDSVAALVPKKELDGEIGDAQVGMQARMMSQMCRKITGITKATNTAVIFINQFRANISTTGFGGPNKTASGGSALNYFSSVIIEVAKIQSLKEGNDHSGSKTTANVKKNKLAPPYRVAEFDILFGQGIDKTGEIVDLSERFGLIKRAGSWYKDTEGKALAQGKNGMSALLKENPTYENELRTSIISIIRANATVDLQLSIANEEAEVGV